jgi:hypothetical protein
MVHIFASRHRSYPAGHFLGGAYLFIENFQNNALSGRTRISLSGDVHSPAADILKTLSKAWRSSAPDPALGHWYMLNVMFSTF